MVPAAMSSLTAAGLHHVQRRSGVLAAADDTVEGTTMDRTMTSQLTGRDRAILRAVVSGNAELTWGSEPDLVLDGRYCSDQLAAHRLARAGLIAPAAVCLAGQRVAAMVTPAGMRELAAVVPVAA
jgi:hypothetical protein